MAGITKMQVTVQELVPSRAVARCTETSTGKSLDVALLPMRVRLPMVGERWMLDRAYGGWSFAALLTSPRLFAPETHVGETPPPNPLVGQRWVNTPAQVWDGTDWVDE